MKDLFLENLQLHSFELQNGEYMFLSGKMFFEYTYMINIYISKVLFM